jgi:hypothetical protein
MKTCTHTTVAFGELVAAVFDEAAAYSVDPGETAYLATKAVAHIMQRSLVVPRPHVRARRRVAGRVPRRTAIANSRNSS